MYEVSVKIDGISVSVPKGSTILAAAEKAGIRIPTLCYLKDRNVQANCRICVVEVKGMRALQPACSTKVTEGMEILTNTQEVRESRKTNLELIMSDHSWDCHHCLRVGNHTVDELSEELCSFCFFCDCVKDGDCELQALTDEYNVCVPPFGWFGDPYPQDCSTGSLIRNPNKCIKCRRCVVVCAKEQGIGALVVKGRGNTIQVAPALDKSLQESPCVKCGKCLEVCPTGAIYAKEHTDEMLYAARIDKKCTIAQISPTIKAALAKRLNMDEHELDLKQLSAGLSWMGVDYVVSSEWAEEAAKQEGAKKLERALKHQNGTVILSNSSAAIELARKEFSGLAENLVSYPSAEQAFGRFAKTEWAKSIGADPKDVCTITFSDSVSYAAEALQPDMTVDGMPCVDYVFLPNETARLLNKTAVDITRLEPAFYDEFGCALPHTAEPWDALLSAGGKPGISAVQVSVEDNLIPAAVVTGLKEVRAVLEQIKAGECPYRIVRICS